MRTNKNVILNDKNSCSLFYAVMLILSSCNNYNQPDLNNTIENKNRVNNNISVIKNCDTTSIKLPIKTRKNSSEISISWQEPIAWIKQVEGINSNKLIKCIAESKSDSVFIFIPNAHRIIDSADQATYIRAFLINNTKDTIAASLFTSTLLGIKTEIWKNGRWLILQGKNPVIDCGNSLHECTLYPKQFLEFHLEADKIDDGVFKEKMRIVLDLFAKNSIVKKYAISNEIDIMLCKEQIDMIK